MARGKKKTAFQLIEEQMSKIDQQIENHHSKIDELQAKKKDLIQLKKKRELELLQEKIEASGKTVDEFLKLIDQQ